MGQRITNPPETPPGRRVVSIQNRVEISMSEIGVGNNATDRRSLRMSDCKIIRRCSDEFGFADRLQVLRPIGAIAGTALDEDSLDDVVPR